MASKKSGSLYIGVTNDLARRVSEHKTGLADSHTAKYRIHLLVYYEVAGFWLSAMTREKQLKKWRRSWKIQLIESLNPEWKDLSGELF